MRKARFAAFGGIALAAFLYGVPFVPDQNTTAASSLLDFVDFFCYGTRASAIAGGSDASGGEHEHSAPAGVYMPMFLTPPKGGAVYNGPPLDQC
jgi:hypothetical protein